MEENEYPFAPSPRWSPAKKSLGLPVGTSRAIGFFHSSNQSSSFDLEKLRIFTKANSFTNALIKNCGESHDAERKSIVLTFEQLCVLPAEDSLSGSRRIWRPRVTVQHLCGEGNTKSEPLFVRISTVYRRSVRLRPCKFLEDGHTCVVGRNATWRMDETYEKRRSHKLVLVGQFGVYAPFHGTRILVWLYESPISR